MKIALKKHSAPGTDGELRRPEQIVRERMRLELAKTREKANKQIKDQNRKRHARKQRQKGGRK